MGIVSVLHKQRSPRNLLHNMNILNNTDLCIRSWRIKVCRRSVRKRRRRPESCICACNLGFQGWRRSKWGLQVKLFQTLFTVRPLHAGEPKGLLKQLKTSWSIRGPLKTQWALQIFTWWGWGIPSEPASVCLEALQSLYRLPWGPS